MRVPIRMAVTIGVCAGVCLVLAEPRPQSGPPAVVWGPEAGGFMAGISAAKTMYQAGEPIALCLIVKNVSGQTLRLGRRQRTFRQWKFVVTKREGFTQTTKLPEEVPLTLYGRYQLGQLGFSPLDDAFQGAMLEPGQCCSFVLQLNLFYDMTLPGQYTIGAWRRVYADGWHNLGAQGLEIQVKAGASIPASQLLELPIDQYQRQGAVADLGASMLEDLDILRRILEQDPASWGSAISQAEEQMENLEKAITQGEKNAQEKE